MKRPLVTALLALFVAAPAIAGPKVYVDYDKSYDRSTVKTFRWKESDTSLKGDQPFLHSYIVNAIEHYLHDGGLREADSDPDILVTYHTSVKEELRVNSTSMGYSYGPYWRYDPYWYGGYGTTTSTVTSYDRGTLVIDAWDAKTNQLIWRASATDIVPEDPQKAVSKIDRWLKKIVHEWGKVKAREKKEKKRAGEG